MLTTKSVLRLIITFLVIVLTAGSITAQDVKSTLGLSQERADAVKYYLIVNSKIDASRINAIGFGESKPIANNETTDGRKKNRRIDVVIHPTGL